MAASSFLSSKIFLKGSRTDGFGFQSSDLRKQSPPSSVQISIQRRRFPPPPTTPRTLEVRATGNVFGKNFQIATYGESHGGGVGCIISGCPPRMPLSQADLQVELDRRRPGQSRITTPRKETDTCQILSGISEGMTTGTPIHVSYQIQIKEDMITVKCLKHIDLLMQMQHMISNMV
ncbi:chorismate synthase, chloroplastic-like [Iris pallida]|uniref:chorismate synthase n=1 Tax=Iris pallida TaxID=29817 RepID=A0AAX6GQ46_IRIPA|nr:chorismate synthase, chloroplastic-like [Iris pallida]